MKSSLICCALIVAACSPAQRQSSDLLNAAPLQDGGAISCKLELGSSKRYLRLYWGKNYSGAKAVNPDENKETEFWILNQDRLLNISGGQRRELGSIDHAMKTTAGMVGFLMEHVPADLKADIDGVVEVVPSISEIPVAMVMEIAPAWTDGQWHMSQGLRWGEGSEKLILPLSWDGSVRRAPFLLEAGAAALVDSARKEGVLATANWEKGAERASLKCDGMSELGPDFLATKTAEFEAIPLAGSSQEINVASSLLSALTSRLVKSGKVNAFAHVLIGAACYSNFQAWRQKIPAVNLNDAEKRQLAEAIRFNFFQELEKQGYRPWLGYIEQAGGKNPKQILMTASQTMCVDSYMRELEKREAAGVINEAL